MGVKFQQYNFINFLAIVRCTGVEEVERSGAIPK